MIAPHPDDEAIGCGGSVCLHAARGNRVRAVFLTSGEAGLRHLSRDEAWRTREAEAEVAAGVLGLSALTFLRQPDWTLGDHIEATAAALTPHLIADAPDIVYLPHEGDWHPDHCVVLAIVRSALGGHAPVRTRFLTYETWAPLSAYDEAEDVTQVMGQKLRALRCHASQMTYYRYDRAVRGLNQYRGEMTRTRYAEVFRQVWPLEAGRTT